MNVDLQQYVNDHILNLIAKAFISFFFKKPKSCKAVQPTDEPRIILNEGDPIALCDIAAKEETIIDAQAIPEDDGQIAHDEVVVKFLRAKVINAIAQIGIVMTSDDEKMAVKIFPAAAGLARCVYDGTTLKEEFDQQVANNPEYQGSQKCALD